MSYSEEEPAEIVRQQRSKGAKRTTRTNVSPHRSPAQSPLRIISPIQGETTRSETRFKKDLPETSTPQTEERVYQGRLTRSRAAAKTGRERVSKYFEQQFQEETEQTDKRSALQRKSKRSSPETSQSGESSESESTRREMEKPLSSARSKRGKQSAEKAKSPPKRKSKSKKQGVKETGGEKTVELLSEACVTDPEDNETLASLQEKKTRERTMKRGVQKKDRNNGGKKQSWLEVNTDSEQQLFVTQKTSTAAPSQMTETQQSEGERENLSESNDDKD